VDGVQDLERKENVVFATQGLGRRGGNWWRYLRVHGWKDGKTWGSGVRTLIERRMIFSSCWQSLQIVSPAEPEFLTSN